MRPIYYWITAKAEPLLGDFCREFILPRQAIVRAGIGTEEVLNWFHDKQCPWSPTVATKVARGLLAKTGNRFPLDSPGATNSPFLTPISLNRRFASSNCAIVHCPFAVETERQFASNSRYWTLTLSSSRRMNE